jgi:5-methylcytosine-specific restriction endonuclease McrA
MAKYQFSDIERMAIWLAHKRRCAYRDEPIIRLTDLQIDHILPESLLDKPHELEKIKSEYDLPSNFDINSYYNWLPSCSSCNRDKSARVFKKKAIFYYLEMAESKHKRIKRIEQKLENKMKREGFLTRTQSIQLIEEYIKDFVVNNLILSPATKRRDRWIDEYLSKAYQLITEKVAFSVVENLPNNELFLTVVLQATSIALRNHQKEKLEALSNAIVNSVLTTSVNDDINLVFIDLVDELKVSHLRLLRMLYEPDRYSKEESAFLNELENQKHLYAHIVKQLIDHNLISLEAFYSSTDAIIQEEDNNIFPYPPPLPSVKIPSSFPINSPPEKRIKIKQRKREKKSRDIDLVIRLIRDNKSKDCTTEFGSLFIQFIKSPLGNS